MDTTRFNRPRIQKANVDELYGLCLGILADGIVTADEVQFLVSWLNAREHLLDDPIVSKVYEKLIDITTGDNSEESQNDLLKLLLEFTGAPSPSIDNSQQPSVLPLCEPAPSITIDDKVFCFTGTFDFGTRAECQQATEAQGGVSSKGVTKKTDYLVIGNQVTPDWKQQTYGAKIIKAMDYRDNKGASISIISESHWIQHLKEASES